MLQKYKKGILIGITLLGLSSFRLVSAGMVNIDEYQEKVEAILENKETAQTVQEATEKKINHLKLNTKDGSLDKPILISLCLHEIGYNGDALSITPENFRKIIRELKAQGFTFVDANDLVDIKEGKKQQPRKAVFLGFDDGYKDNYTNAYPIIKEEGVKGTFFIVSNMISHENMMTYADIQEMLDNGMAIGSHTANHAELDKMSAEEIHKELNDSKYSLEKSFGVKVNSVAYPCGGENETVIQETGKLYDIAFTASMDESVPNTPLTIHRYGVFRWNNSIGSVLKNN
ncbi:polysaccharide deacetylase family protein [Selenomonas montiformis]|uniref:polysaccharide deacetylase family protein n=1 Tax=Selenomonas montiformis TaxID=2652285 RepID=UPI003F8C3CC9